MGEEVRGKLDFYIQPLFSVIIGASVSNELREMRPPMKSSMYVIKWMGAVCLLTACLCPVFAAEIDPYVDPAWLSTQSTASQLGACKISILQTYFWRDCKANNNSAHSARVRRMASRSIGAWK
jgi:hypothetical protein